MANSIRARGGVSRVLLVALALAAIVGGVAALKIWLKPATKPALDVGRTVVEEFLGLVREGQAGPAWEGATAEFKSIEGRESFIRSAAKAAVLKKPLHFGSMQEVKLNDEPRAEYIFQSADGKMVRVLVGFERGTWKVDRLTL